MLLGGKQLLLVIREKGVGTIQMNVGVPNGARIHVRIRVQIFVGRGLQKTIKLHIKLVEVWCNDGEFIDIIHHVANGEPLIDDSCKRAVKQYVNYRITVRDRKRDRNKVPMSEVDYERQQWVILKNQAAGRINMPTLLEMPSIVKQFYNAGITIDMVVDRYNRYWNNNGRVY